MSELVTAVELGEHLVRRRKMQKAPSKDALYARVTRFWRSGRIPDPVDEGPPRRWDLEAALEAFDGYVRPTTKQAQVDRPPTGIYDAHNPRPLYPEESLFRPRH